MRVIAGSAGGHPLAVPPKGTRPVSDRAREGLFSSLGGAVVDAVCLDLFAGSGALGIEALSRGAASCTFVDRARTATATIVRNLRTTDLEDRATVLTREVSSFLQDPGPHDPGSHDPGLREPRTDGPPVDLVFLDPPYELAGPPLDDPLAALDRRWLPADGWTVVVTRGHKAALPAVPIHWSSRRQLRYGDSLVILYGP